MYFPVADIELHPIIPLAIGLAVSLVSSPTGVSGGFLILPLHMSFFGFTSLAVSPTNFLFNIVAMPSGLWRLHREKRLMWGLGGLIMAGCLPGIFIGTIVRCTWLKRAADFKIFVGLVLLVLALGLIRNLWRSDSATSQAERAFRQKKGGPASLYCRYDRRFVTYDFGGEHFAVSTPRLLGLALGVGLVGGVYGIGGAAIIAPLLISFFKMPIYLVNGASLLAGWAGAVFGLFSYVFFWPLFSGQPPVIPDLRLGGLFGLGGIIGVYLGSAIQRHVPPRPLKILLLFLVAVLAAQNLNLL